jgi:SNF2 family DNA or RNA helicase
MAATLHAELDAAGSTVILVAVGDSTDVNQMAQALKHVTPGFKRSEPPGALLMELSWAGITQLAHTFDGIAEHGFWVPGPRLRAWIAAEFEARVSESRLAPMTWTGTDGRTPRPYQLDAARMIDAAGKFLLFDEPGTGKSASTILGLSRRLLRGIDVFPAVIIAPSWDVIDNWTREIALWMPAWRVIEWKGADRARHLRFRDAYDVFVTTYATARRDARDVRGPLVKLNAATVVVDELHWTKSADAQQTQAVERIARHATSFVGLTGTPITRDTGDIFPALKSMDPAAWPAKERFVKRYCTTGDGDYDNPVEGLDRLYEGEFRACLLGSYRRVAKADVLDQLPKKIYSVRHVDLPDEWRKAYREMETNMLATLPDGGELPVFSTLAQLTRLLQMASSAFDVTMEMVLDEESGEERPHYDVALRAPSWKVDVLMEILAERPGQPVVVFAPFRQLIMIAGEAAAKAGLAVGYVTGIGQGVTRASRQADIAAFQAGKLDLLAVTTQAGGTGLNLTAAGTAVFLQRPWPLADAIQAEDRIHRIGSEIHQDGVEIIDIVARSTVDYRVRARLREKGSQLAEFVQDPRILRELLGGL